MPPLEQRPNDEIGGKADDEAQHPQSGVALSSHDTAVARLHSAKSMLEMGLITADEYGKTKAAILASLSAG